jgi:hypothetical protein
LASLALWLLLIAAVLAWWLSRRKSQRVSNGELPRGAAAAVKNTPQPARTLQAAASEAARRGDAAACEHALLAWAQASHPDMASMAALRQALSDPVQRDALDALQRARWQGGDAAVVCSAVADAFASGFKWRNDGKPPRSGSADLPPLYPPRD